MRVKLTMPSTEVNQNVKLSPFKQFVGRVYLQGWSIINGITAAITGEQLQLLHWLWAKKKYEAREESFKRLGFFKVQLLEKTDWQNLSNTVDQLFNEKGFQQESKVDWAINKSFYLDLESLSELNKSLSDIANSDIFVNTVNRLTGGTDWKVVHTQVWRNYPEDFDNTKKEINATFYHVDNGGDKEHRLIINVFMYLSEINLNNGPFTYFDSETSKKINRKYFFDIIKYGNLRKYWITKKIESKFKPHLLLDGEGKALIINNQVCLHRAGFCSKGSRDMLQFLISTNN